MTDRFEEFLRSQAPRHHGPGPTPREEMWAAIAAERKRRAAARAGMRRGLRWIAAVAAVLVLGIAIGRVTAPTPSPVVAEEGTGLGFQVLATEHLGRAEALLTMFRAEAQQGQPDRAAATTARNLLSTNRLLLDSPAAADPRMKTLLEDLELVLVQIAQVSAEQGENPAEFILRALEDNGVLLRLRSQAPPGQSAAVQGAI